MVVTDPIVRERLLPDAQALLNTARTQLAGLSSDHPGRSALQAAADALAAVISGNPSQTALTQAMAALTQAMAGAR